MASVTYNGVTKRFEGGNVAVDQLDLHIADTEFMVLVGPSGCGKSTALRMLAGLEDVTDGEIRLGDAPINNVPARHRDIAMVFQSYALYPHKSVRANMAFGLKMRGAPKAEIDAEVTQAARILGLADLLDRKPGQLSGGQRQRVALGRAIVRKPQVFLLDEPLSNLDAALRVQTRVELMKLHERLGTTFVYVTHDQVEAMTMGTRIAVMRDGRLQQVAPPREIFERPVNMYVAGFVGSPKMNFLPVEIDGTTARGGDLVVNLPRAPGVARGILGARPEAFTELTPEGMPTVELIVDVVEILGSDQYAYGRVGADEVVARLDPHTDVGHGSRIRLGIDTRRLHVFDPETELALL